MKILLICICAGALIYSGCSSSSGSLRYNKTKEVKTKENSPVRFTSQQENPPKESNITSDADTASGFYNNYENNDNDDIDDFPDEDPVTNLSEVMNKLSATNHAADLSADNSTSKEKMLMEIIKYLNTPYKYGGTSKDGIDCSAFTQAVFNKTFNIPLLRTAQDQYTMGIEINSRENLEFGDLIFFNTRRRVSPGHVGIYIGDNLFAHSSTKYGVIVSSLDLDYYSKRFMGGRRIEGKLVPHM